MSFVGFPMGEATGYPTGKMKRKEVEDVFDDFSDFSLSSPARKMRRLDIGLPPIVEEEEQPISMAIGFRSNNEQPPTIVELEPSSPPNEERALVLYKPVKSPMLEPEVSNVSFRVNTDWISGFKNQMFRAEYTNSAMNNKEESSPGADKIASSNTCLAVIPWTPSDFPEATNGMQETGLTRNMEQVEMDVEEDAPMDVEEQSPLTGSSAVVRGPLGANERKQQWQQHCMNSQLPTRSSTPVMWSW